MKIKLYLMLFFCCVTSIYSQIKPIENVYYSVDINTPAFVKSVNDTNKIYLPAGTVIQIRSTEEPGKVFFLIYKGDSSLVKLNLYVIKASDFTKKYFSERASFKGGILTVPFKYRPDKKKIFPGGNIAFAASYSYSRGGIAVQPLVFAGLSAITISNINVDSTSSETKFGISLGLGLNIAVVEAFSFGVVSGWDLIDEKWDSNGKIWFAFSFNYSFLN